MNASKTAATRCTCPSCEAYTVAMPNGGGDYCPSCHTLVQRLRHVKVVKPNAFAPGAARF